ncbi:MAG TPA: class I SAM-dependent methyltransferase, partial [Chthoniobacterales bacterium]|nr:class I SAM-dependent methyltransferase [Chthoniobacterales bacterium]
MTGLSGAGRDFSLSMFEKLPSLREFQPKFYSGGAVHFHLPLLYDLVAQARPKRLVVVGFGNGDAFFTACQAASEQKVDCECVAVRRDRDGGSENDDAIWREGRAEGEEFYGKRARFFASPENALSELAEGSIDVLWLDDSDSGTEIRNDLSAWEPKLSANATVLLHGLGVERNDNPVAAWNEWTGHRVCANYPAGVGLGIAVLDKSSAASFLVKHSDDLAVLYAVAAARIDAEARAAAAAQKTAAFETRQVWLDSLLTDRRKVQEIMDHQARVIASLEGQIGSLEGRIQLLLEAAEEQRGHFENLRRDRAKAQLIMDTQHEQLKRLVTQTDALREKAETFKTQLKEHKAILSAAKKACRKGGRCFQIQSGEKVRRPLRERIARELRRLPRNLGIAGKKETESTPQRVDTAVVPSPRADRYEVWIAEHEPNAAALEKQRKASKEFSTRPKISLLTPVHNTPAKFLEEMFASVAAQTYENWELCVVDAA